MWPFVSKRAKKMVEEVIANGTLKAEDTRTRCAGLLLVDNLLSFEYDGYELSVGENMFGLTGSRYFWLFNSRDRKWIWKRLLKEVGYK